jgi:hypothetical protein
MESSMQALDIPLSVICQVNDGLYASLGVSSFAVLTENKAYQYEMDVLTEKKAINPMTDAEFTEYIVATKEFSEPVKDTDFKGHNNLGYLNFSVAKGKSFSGKRNLFLDLF